MTALATSSGASRRRRCERSCRPFWMEPFRLWQTGRTLRARTSCMMVSATRSGSLSKLLPAFFSLVPLSNRFSLLNHWRLLSPRFPSCSAPPPSPHNPERAPHSIAVVRLASHTQGRMLLHASKTYRYSNGECMAYAALGLNAGTPDSHEGGGRAGASD